LKAALVVLANVVREKLTLSHTVGEQSARAFIARKSLLGKWLRAVALFERSLWLAVSNPWTDQAVREWSEAAFRRLLGSLERTSSAQDSISDAETSLAESHAVVKEYRSGKFPRAPQSCAATLVEDDGSA
jgi:hypothetical protein